MKSIYIYIYIYLISIKHVSLRIFPSHWAKGGSHFAAVSLLHQVNVNPWYGGSGNPRLTELVAAM
mgnify:CR=1 FL=1